MNQVNKNGGLYESTEPHAHQALELGSCCSPQLGNIWSKPSGWDSLPLTMKQNMRPSCPDWTSPLLYPSPNSGSTATHNSYKFTEWTIEKIKRADNRRADALAGIAASLPIKKTILLPIHVQANPSVAEILLATPLRQIKQMIKNGRITSQNISGQALCPEIPNKHTKSGNVKVSLRPMALCAVGHGHSGTPPSSACPEKFLLVATDYFSKWVEAEAYASIKDKDVTKFVWKNIVCRFGIPQTIIADNGPQFDSIAFRNFCSELNIRNSYSTQRYPQSNGQAEATNKTLINALKKRLEQAKGKWGRSYRLIPTEIGLPTIRTDAAKQDDTSAELGKNLDWADEVRENAAIRMADYQQRASAHYNRKVRPRSFKNGTLVLRKVFENTAEVGTGKFQANWEGPYIVSKASENGAYHLQKLDGTPLLRPWNVSNLKYYQ
ncbi:Pol polyprotein [Vitis vinifera]|uniref:Pol polyprotein n=1 Tax=Vitis vinifera TaxID=29760 RepID=A0A438G5U5_VITVI|nr:Pol polyprotein [Vitis vinifera]